MSATVQIEATLSKEFKNEIKANIKEVLDEVLEEFIEEVLEHLKPATVSEYVTRQQASTMFDVDISTIHNWTKRGVLRSFGIGGRIYYLRSDIEASLIPLNQ